MNSVHPIRELRETRDPDEANDWLGDGWTLLGAFQYASVADGRPVARTLYVLTKGGTDRSPLDVDSIEELSGGSINDALTNGAVLLKVVTHSDTEGEYPRFVVGWPSTPAMDNGVH